jgi:hypothetical protein
MAVTMPCHVEELSCFIRKWTFPQLELENTQGAVFYGADLPCWQICHCVIESVRIGGGLIVATNGSG